ncbi:MAG: hypothetical protein WCS52_15660 [bacterium]
MNEDKKKTVRKKPAMGITVDAEVKQWLEEQATLKHRKPSQLINEWLWEKMESEGGKCKDGKHCGEVPRPLSIRHRAAGVVGLGGRK